MYLRPFKDLPADILDSKIKRHEELREFMYSDLAANEYWKLQEEQRIREKESNDR